MEIWKDIDGYEGIYQVSNTGRVMSLKRNTIKQSSLNINGYFRIGLYKNNLRTNFYIHRLVATAFIDNPNNLPQVNHKDEIKSNNYVNNLEWCTVKYNTNYGNGNAKNAQKQKKPIKQMDLNGNVIRLWESALDCAKSTGANRACISLCCTGKAITTSGYKWQFAR